MKIESKCLHAGYEPKNGEPRVLPIYQSTTYKYDSTDFVGQLFDLTAEDTCIPVSPIRRWMR